MAKKRKTRHKSTARLVGEASTLAQRYARVRDADDCGYCTCVTCGKVGYFEKDGIQGGHFIERGKSPTRLLSTNIHPQCAYCNHHGMKKASVVLKYRNYMVDRYGEEHVAYLENLSRKTYKWNRVELIDFIEQTKELIDNELIRISYFRNQ